MRASGDGSSVRAGGRRGPLVYAALVPVVGVAAAGVWATLKIVGPGPERAEAATTAAPGSSEAVLGVARGLMMNDQAAQAEVVLREALATDPGDQQMRLLYAEALLVLGRAEEAYEQYTRAIFIGPDHAEYRHAAGTIASQLGLTEDAEAHYAVAQTLDPANPKYPLYRAQVQRKLGMTDAARANLMMATRIDPELALAWGSLAAIALEEDNRHMALQYVEKARALEPHRSVWRVTQAKALRGLGRAEEAAALLYAIAEDERVGDPTVLMEIALCHGLMREPAKAASVYEDAVRRRPDHPEYAYEAALWHERAGDAEEAKYWAAAAAQLGHQPAFELERRLAGEEGVEGRGSAVEGGRP